MKRVGWITVSLVVVAGAFALQGPGGPSENRAAPRKQLASSPAPDLEVLLPSTDGPRTVLLPRPGTAPRSPSVVPAHSSPTSSLSRDIQDITSSFLTELPRVTDLLGLVEQLASLAVIDPDSVTVQRNDAGELKTAGGQLDIGDLAGTFQVDPDGISVQLVIPLAEGPWSSCHLQIAFEEGESGPRGCHASVKFEGQEDELLARDRGETLVGWAIGVSPGNALARPLTVAWGSRSGQPREFLCPPSCVRGFDAWLTLLKASASR